MGVVQKPFKNYFGMTIRLVRFLGSHLATRLLNVSVFSILIINCLYMIIQHLCDLESPTTSLVLPENLGTVPALGERVNGFNWTGMSCLDTSDSEFKLWLFVDARLLSTGLPFVLI